MTIANRIKRAYLASADYKGEQANLNYYRSLCLREAITRAAFGDSETGPPSSHFNKIPKTALANGRQLLAIAMDQLKAAQSFSDIHKITSLITARIHGLKALWAYDTAVCLGAQLGHMPQDVWLHAGAADGAALMGIRGPYRPITDFPPCWRSLGGNGIESLLCWAHRICPDDLKQINPPPATAAA